MNSQELKKLNIPDRPGVYFFKKDKEILYIGKATSLRDRVKSYFGKDLIATRGPLILDMIFKTKGLKWQETDSVLEALILEANLIKKYQPIYNTKEKSDKSFNYVCITKDPLPKIIIKRGKDILQKQGNFSRFTLPGVLGGTHATKNSPVSFANIYGPFPNGSQLKEALKIIRRVFPFLDEKSKSNYEFYKQLQLAPERNDYKKNIKNIKLLFEGKKKSILKNLEKEMGRFARTQEFEKAGEIKKKIFALKHIQDVALIKDDRITEGFFRSSEGGQPDTQKSFSNPVSRIEAYDIAHMGGKEMVGVMTVLEDGEVNKSEYRKFKIKGFENANDTGALLEVLERRFSHQEWTMPRLIVIDGGKAQLNTALKFQEKVGLQIPVVSVVKDEHHKPKQILFAPSVKDFFGPRKGVSQTLKNPSLIALESLILLANSESHCFAIGYHRHKVRKLFIKKHT